MKVLPYSREIHTDDASSMTKGLFGERIGRTATIYICCGISRFLKIWPPFQFLGSDLRTLSGLETDERS